MMTSDDLIEIISRNTWPIEQAVPKDPVIIENYAPRFAEDVSIKDASEAEQERADSVVQWARLNIFSRLDLLKQLSINGLDPRHPEHKLSAKERNSIADAHFLILVQFLALYQGIHQSNQVSKSILAHPFEAYDEKIRTAADMNRYRTLILEFLNRIPAGPASEKVRKENAQNRLDRAMECLNALLENPEGPITYKADDGTEKTLSIGACKIFSWEGMKTLLPVYGLIVGQIKLPEVPISNEEFEEWKKKIRELAALTKEFASVYNLQAIQADQLKSEVEKLCVINPKAKTEAEIVEAKVALMHKKVHEDSEAGKNDSMDAYAIRVKKYADDADKTLLNGETKKFLEGLYNKAYGLKYNTALLVDVVSEAEFSAKQAVERARLLAVKRIDDAKAKAVIAEKNAKAATTEAHTADALVEEAKILAKIAQAQKAGKELQEIREQVQAAHDYSHGDDPNCAEKQAKNAQDAANDAKGIKPENLHLNKDRVLKALVAVDEGSEGVVVAGKATRKAILNAKEMMKILRDKAKQQINDVDTEIKDLELDIKAALDSSKKIGALIDIAKDVLRIDPNNQDAKDVSTHVRLSRDNADKAQALLKPLKEKNKALQALKLDSTKAAMDAERYIKEINDISEQIGNHLAATAKEEKGAHESLAKALKAAKEKFDRIDQGPPDAENDDQIYYKARKLADAAGLDANEAEKLREEAEEYRLIPGADIVISHIEGAHNHAHERLGINGIHLPNCARQQALVCKKRVEESRLLAGEDNADFDANVKKIANCIEAAKAALKKTEVERKATAAELEAAQKALVQAQVLGGIDNIAKLANEAANQAKLEIGKMKVIFDQCAPHNPSETDKNQALALLATVNQQVAIAKKNAEEANAAIDFNDKEAAQDGLKGALEGRNRAITARQAMERLRDSIIRLSAARKVGMATPIKPVVVPANPAAAPKLSNADLLKRVIAARKRRGDTRQS